MHSTKHPTKPSNDHSSHVGEPNFGAHADAVGSTPAEPPPPEVAEPAPIDFERWDPDDLLDPQLGALDPASANPAERTRLAAWLQLQATLGLKPQTAAAALAHFRDPDRVFRGLGISGALSPRELEAARLALVRLRAIVLPLLSPAYPSRLRQLSDPAPVLSVSGAAAAEPDLLNRVAVAIVGARAATAYGLRTARRLGRGLAEAGAVVVSGLARGIDAEAHRGALEAGGVTVAIQGCGPGQIYPREHRSLAAAIESRGGIVSELPVGAPPRGVFFPLRNRLISGLSQVVVIVEARERSGSLVTARHALNQGIEVMAVPGPVDCPTSAGPNRLLREGAAPALSAADVLAAIGIELPTAAAAEASKQPQGPPPASAAGRAILAALAHQPANRDELAARLELAVDQLSLALLELELAGQVATDRDGRLSVVPAAARRS